MAVIWLISSGIIGYPEESKVCLFKAIATEPSLKLNLNTNYYKRHYTSVRLKTNSFFGDLFCTESDTNANSYTTDEYTIIQGNVLRFNFKEGSVAIA